MGRGYLHGCIGRTHEQYQQGNACVRHGRHGHGHAQRYDGVGTADNGAEEKYQGKYHGKGNGQTSEKYRQFMDDID